MTAEFDGGDESAAAAAVEAVSEKVEDLARACPRGIVPKAALECWSRLKPQPACAVGDLDFGKKKKKKKKNEEGGEGEAGAEEPPAEEATGMRIAPVLAPAGEMLKLARSALI